MHLGQRTTEHGEILREDIDRAAVDGAITCDDPIAQELLAFEPELVAAMGDEHAYLLKAAFVQQEMQAFAGGHLALGVLRVDAFLTTAQLGKVLFLLQFVQLVFHPVVLCPWAMGGQR